MSNWLRGWLSSGAISSSMWMISTVNKIIMKKTPWNGSNTFWFDLTGKHSMDIASQTNRHRKLLLCKSLERRFIYNAAMFSWGFSIFNSILAVCRSNETEMIWRDVLLELLSRREFLFWCFASRSSRHNNIRIRSYMTRRQLVITPLILEEAHFCQFENNNSVYIYFCTYL